MRDFLEPQTVAALGATQFLYSREFTIAAIAGGQPNTQGSGGISIQSGFHFFMESIWIAYPTVQEVESDVVDDGVCRLTYQMNLGTTTPMFQNPVRLDLIGVPGRMPVSGALTAAGEGPQPGQAPHIEGFPFKRFMAAGTNVQNVFANSSNLAATIALVLRGWNIPAESCPTFTHFNRVVQSHQFAPSVA
jgi:hypothetical protein